MREGLAAAVAGGAHLHQARIERVLHIAAQDAVFDQHIVLGGVAFVVHVERAAPAGQRAIVDHGHALGGHALADAAGKHAGALAVEVAFQAMAHGLVQQDAGPARAQHHRHLAGRRGPCFEIDHGFVHGAVHVFAQHFVGEHFQADAPASAAMAHFTPAALLGDHGERQAHQRPHIRGQAAVAAGHQHHVVFGAQAGHDLDHARIGRARHALDALEQGDLLGRAQRGQGVDVGIQLAGIVGRHLGRHLDLARAAPRDAAHGMGRGQQRLRRQAVGIGESRFFAADRAHAHALPDRKAAGLDDAFLQAPAFAAGVLEIQVGIIDLVRKDLAQGLGQIDLGQAPRVEQQGFGGGQGLDRGIDGFHSFGWWGVAMRAVEAGGGKAARFGQASRLYRTADRVFFLASRIQPRILDSKCPAKIYSPRE